MAETMGAGALAGHLLVSAVVSGGVQVATETMSDTVVADADRAAKGIAKQLSSLFTQQGWITRQRGAMKGTDHETTWILAGLRCSPARWRRAVRPWPSRSPACRARPAPPPRSTANNFRRPILSSAG